MSEKTYTDSEGYERTLYGMVRDEKEWACNRIRQGEKAIESLSKLREAALRVISNGPCSDPDCCAMAMDNEAARQHLATVLKETLA